MLSWLRIVDAHDGRLSLTSLAFLGTGIHFAVFGTWESLVAFAVASALYALRRPLIHRGAARAQAIEAASQNAQEAWKQARETEKALDRLDQRVAAVENRPRLR